MIKPAAQVPAFFIPPFILVLQRYGFLEPTVGVVILPDEESKKKRCGTPHLLTELKNRILINRY